VTIRGDGNRLWQIVNNLLDNAIKFTPAGGRVSLDLWLDESHHSSVLEVTDSGDGISPHDLPHIFDRFYRANGYDGSTTGPQSGFGLGLAIVREIAVNHGGTVNVASEIGKGTTFTIDLPSVQKR